MGEASATELHQGGGILLALGAGSRFTMSNDEDQWRIVGGLKQRAMLQCAKKGCLGTCPRSRAQDGWDSSSNQPLATCRVCSAPFRKHQGKLVWQEVSNVRKSRASPKQKAAASTTSSSKPSPKTNKDSVALAKLQLQFAEQKKEIERLKSAKSHTENFGMDIDEDTAGADDDIELNQIISRIQKRFKVLRNCDPLLRDSFEGGYEEQIASHERHLKEAQARRRGKKPLSTRKSEQEKYLQRLLTAQQTASSHMEEAIKEQEAVMAKVAYLLEAEVAANTAIEVAKAELLDITQQMADELKGDCGSAATAAAANGGSAATGAAAAGSSEVTANAIVQYFNGLAPQVVGDKKESINRVMELLHEIDSRNIQVKADPKLQVDPDVLWDDNSLLKLQEQMLPPLGEDASEEQKSDRCVEVAQWERRLGALKGKRVLETTGVRKSILKGGAS